MRIWVGIFPTVETIAAQVAGGVFVVGSYMLAEQLKNRRRRRRAVPAASNGRPQDGEPLPTPAAPASDIGISKR